MDVIGWFWSNVHFMQRLWLSPITQNPFIMQAVADENDLIVRQHREADLKWKKAVEKALRAQGITI